MPVQPDRSTAEALARLYDVDLQEDPGDLGLYLALAARTGGPILELASGSGRLAVPLAAAGYKVTGVDIDAAMLDRARSRAREAGKAIGRRLEFVEADLLTWRPETPTYRLAFIGLNSILLLTTREAQAAAFETMACALAPGGLAVVDAWLPSAEELARYDGRIGLEYVREDPETGNTVVKTASAEHEVATNRVRLTTVFEEGEQGAPARRWVRQDLLRLVGPDELTSMADSAGLEIEAVAGGYDMEPIGPYDDRVVLIARSGPRSARSREV